jgi:hypothetical protein
LNVPLLRPVLSITARAWQPPAWTSACYIRALANHDASGLGVAADIPPVRITSADLTYSANARAEQATATFTPRAVDSTFWLVTITYADEPWAPPDNGPPRYIYGASGVPVT